MATEIVSTTERYLIKPEERDSPWITALILLDHNHKVCSIELVMTLHGSTQKFEMPHNYIKPVMDFFSKTVTKHLVFKELAKEGEKDGCI